MSALIDDLLRFSRTSLAETTFTNVDLGQLVESIVAELDLEEKGRNIVWKKGALPVVQGDAAMLYQVLVNLLANALKYTRPRACAEIEIGCHDQTGPDVEIFVRDNGVGFDPRSADRLFGVFQRLHRDDEFEGTGIGLANVRRIVERHNGRTWAESRLGEGATFYFTLPNVKQKSVSAAR
jgi:light-regulated signal transduction histidine kinase (bacteriophytochrome)